MLAWMPTSRIWRTKETSAVQEKPLPRLLLWTEAQHQEEARLKEACKSQRKRKAWHEKNGWGAGGKQVTLSSTRQRQAILPGAQPGLPEEGEGREHQAEEPKQGTGAMVLFLQKHLGRYSGVPVNVWSRQCKQQQPFVPPGLKQST